MNETYPACMSFIGAAGSATASRVLTEPYSKPVKIAGIWRIDASRVMEVNVMYQAFPSFCGGAYAYYPTCDVHRDRGRDRWSNPGDRFSVIGLGRREDAPTLADITGLLTLSDGTWTDLTSESKDEDWRRYGFRILANGLFTKMASVGKRGVVLSGPVASYDVADFCAEATKLTQVRQLSVDWGHTVIPWNVMRREMPGQARVVTTSACKVELQEVGTWNNYNSGNEVRWWPLLLSMPKLGGLDYDESGYRLYGNPWDAADEHWRDVMDEDDRAEWYDDFDRWYDAEGRNIVYGGDVQMEDVEESELESHFQMLRWLHRNLGN